MRKLPNDLGGFFYDDADMNGLLYWYEAIKFKVNEDVKFKSLILKGLGYKDAS